MKNEQFEQYIQDFISTELEDEGNSNQKHAVKAWVFTVLGIISFIIWVTTFVTSIENGIAVISIAFILMVIFVCLAIYSFKRSKGTTAKNVDIISDNLHRFVSKYLELVHPEFVVEDIDLKIFGGSEVWFQIGEATYYCDADIEEIIRYELVSSGKNATTVPVHYFINRLSVRLSYEPLPIENAVGIKLGKTKEKNIDEYVSESIEFNKTYKVNSSKTDGFKLLTPIRIDSLMNNKHLMGDIKFNITGNNAEFYREWEIRKTFNRSNTLASKPLTTLSANDDIMCEEITKHVKEIVENPIKNWKIMETLLLHK
ncbi:hypothetical protein [Spiroplasma endosymbiont of Othius punctulatus]|uniref:hypothetical protein n=1 Tax=Spiroplasma endosymbiont of Othius punctulatus TaxID=3066289 RepID=UPI0030D1D284